ncbi:hypothetical protein ACFSX9_09375 [Flavobacterium ardleyense]|uniref:Cell wall anchor protein n=1 Tax=Flavobacterium ardleyense TaxID=2038737 RepID=A0ABW5Z8C0_9FLAO
MIKINYKLRNCICVFMFLFTMQYAFAQVGINTTTPHPSSILDVSSAEKGMLAPRLTTVQRLAITTPAESLLVYDTTEKGFYYYNNTSSSWIKLANDNKRNNYKLIKSVADLAQESIDGGGAGYLLNTNTFYEINGTITLVKPINLNDAYVSGLDANEDVLSFPGGTVFEGTKGGSIKNVTLKGAQAFNITGPGIATNSSLLIQNTIIDGMTTGVGNISSLGLYYGGIVQFINNANGIVYSNIGNCLLDNQAWLSSNNGTFEKFTGGFGLVEKGSGFSTVNGNDIAFDVSAVGLTIGTGTLSGTVFSGTTTAPSGYIKGYAPANTYPGYNFSDVWYVDSPGIPREGDAAATGNLYKSNRTFVETDTNAGTPGLKLNTPITLSTNLFRFSSATVGRLTYEGKKPRAFQATATLSYEGVGSNTNTDYVFYFVRVGSNGISTIPLPETEIFSDSKSNSIISTITVSGTIVLAENESIEVHVQRIGGSTTKVNLVSYNLSIK